MRKAFAILTSAIILTLGAPIAYAESDVQMNSSPVSQQLAYTTETDSKGIAAEPENNEQQNNDQGVKTPGWHRTDKGWEYWLADGKQLVGEWLYLNDGTYYLGQDGIALTGVNQISDASYFFDSSCRMKKGWIDDGQKRYFASESGKLKTGWQWIEGSWYWFDPADHVMASNCWIVDRGSSYAFAGNGAMLASRWHKDADGWHYLGGNGAALKGWRRIGGSWYWFDPADHVMATGLIEEGGKSYFLLPSGAMSIGWAWDDSASCWRHAKGDGALSSGWLLDSGTWYWLDPETHVMASNCWIVDRGSSYAFAGNGAMLASRWHKDADGWHYLGGNGAALKGWQSLAAGKFFFSVDNNADHHAAYVGIREIDGKTYYFDVNTGLKQDCWIPISPNEYGYAHSNGEIGIERLRDGTLWLDDSTRASGFATIGSKKYFADPLTGKLVKGWQKIENVYYYFDQASFHMRRGWLQDGANWYWLDMNTGAMKTGWLLNKNVWYWFDSTGAMAREWKYIDGHWYFFNPTSGAMHTGPLYWKGKYYFMNSNGQMLDLNVKYPDMIIRAQGYSSSTPWLLVVDTTGCRTGVYRGRKDNWQPIHEWSCCVGAPSTPTPKGQFTVTGKGYSFGRGYTCYYYTQFWGDYLFHSILFDQGTFNVQDGRMGMQISHGCIRLPLASAKWIYDNIPYGTKVVIY